VTATGEDPTCCKDQTVALFLEQPANDDCLFDLAELPSQMHLICTVLNECTEMPIKKPATPPPHTSKANTAMLGR
jgi:hypothetical protein